MTTILGYGTWTIKTTANSAIAMAPAGNTPLRSAGFALDHVPDTKTATPLEFIEDAAPQSLVNTVINDH